MPAVPALKSKLQNPVTLEFREAPLKLVMEALARSAGINFIIDRDVRPDLKASIFVRNVLIHGHEHLPLLNQFPDCGMAGLDCTDQILDLPAIRHIQQQEPLISRQHLRHTEQSHCNHRP